MNKISLDSPGNYRPLPKSPAVAGQALPRGGRDLKSVNTEFMDGFQLAGNDHTVKLIENY